MCCVSTVARPETADEALKSEDALWNRLRTIRAILRGMLGFRAIQDEAKSPEVEEIEALIKLAIEQVGLGLGDLESLEVFLRGEAGKVKEEVTHGAQ